MEPHGRIVDRHPRRAAPRIRGRAVEVGGTMKAADDQSLASQDLTMVLASRLDCPLRLKTANLGNAGENSFNQTPAADGLGLVWVRQREGERRSDAR